MTGARRSQLLAMRWSDVDFDHAAVGFSRALGGGTDRAGAAADQEPAHLPGRAGPGERRAARRPPRPSAAHAGGSADGFVFSGDAGGRRPWQPNWVTKRFITYRRRAGLASFRLHDLRHFMATTMLAAGVPVPVVSERLCHARTSTTVNIYAHAMPGADRHAANLLAELPWSSCRGLAELRV